MSTILDDLKSLRDQKARDAPHRAGELPEIEIDLLDRAIKEIEHLRAVIAAHDFEDRPGDFITS
jgi:hypothetical protein